MGLISERERGGGGGGRELLFRFSTDTPETALLITSCSINIHQCDPCHSQDPNVPSSLETGRTYPHLPSH